MIPRCNNKVKPIKNDDYLISNFITLIMLITCLKKSRAFLKLYCLSSCDQMQYGRMMFVTYLRYRKYAELYGINTVLLQLVLIDQDCICLATDTFSVIQSHNPGLSKHLEY